MPCNTGRMDILCAGFQRLHNQAVEMGKNFLTLTKLTDNLISCLNRPRIETQDKKVVSLSAGGAPSGRWHSTYLYILVSDVRMAGRPVALSRLLLVPPPPPGACCQRAPAHRPQSRSSPPPPGASTPVRQTSHRATESQVTQREAQRPGVSK